MNIVIVDDAGYVIELLRNILEDAGHSVVAVVTTAVEALQVSDELQPDIIFLDLVLPERNGLELAQDILQKNPLQNIIVCSSLDEVWIKEKAKEIGCKYFLEKPFTKKQVLDSLQFVQLLKKELSYG